MFMNMIQANLSQKWMILKLSMFFGILGITSVTACVKVDFDQLVRDPGGYQGSCVCVTGVTEGDGINFALFRPGARQANNTILVVNTRAPRYNPVDGHWVNVCGTVIPDEQRYFACKLVLESAHALDKRPIPGHRIFGVFENDGRQTVKVQVISQAGNEGTVMILRPGDITESVITDGKIKVFAGPDDRAEAKPLSERVMPTIESASNYFERSTRTFYFSIRGGKVSFLKPAEAIGMRKRWEVLKKEEQTR
jgi:hypothetical protein